LRRGKKEERKYPATERHACRPAPNNIAESSPTALSRINLLKIETTAFNEEPQPLPLSE
jgi:hypothetical protein